jgi:hypothetical protein
MIYRVLASSCSLNVSIVRRAAASSACSARSTTPRRLSHLSLSPALSRSVRNAVATFCQCDRCNSQIRMSYLYVDKTSRCVGPHTKTSRCHHHMIELGHTRMDQCAKLACALSPHYLLVDINVSLQVWKFFCAPAVPIAVSVSPVSISSSVFSSLVVPPIPTCVAAPHFPALTMPLPFPLPLPLPRSLPLPVPIAVSVSPVSISSSAFSSLVVQPIPTCVAAPHFPLLISSTLSTQRADSSSLLFRVSVSAPAPILSVPITPLVGIHGSACVSVSAPISSLLVAVPVPERARGASYKYPFIPSSAPAAATRDLTTFHTTQHPRNRSTTSVFPGQRRG